MVTAASPIIIGAEATYKPIQAWLSVGILTTFSILSIMDRQMVALLVDPIKRDLGLSDTNLGLLQGAAFAVVYSVAGLPIGWAVDRYSRRLVIYLGITLWSFGAAYCGLASSFWRLFAGRAIVGVGEATVAPVAVSLISGLFPANRVGTAMGVYAAGFNLGSGVALAMGGLVAGIWEGQTTATLPLLGTMAPWKAVFLLTGLPGLAVALLAFRLAEPRLRVQREIPRWPTPTAADYVRTRGRAAAACIAAFAVAPVVMYAVSGWTPAFLARSFGWSAAHVGTDFGLAMSIPGALGSLVGGWAIDRVFRAGVRDASLVVPAACTAVALPFMTLAYFVNSPTLCLILLASGLFLFSAAGPAAYATWQMIAPAHLRGRLTVAYVFVASIFGTSLGPLAVGLVSDHIFADEAMVGRSIALVLAVAMPTMIALLLAARKSLRSFEF
jgi:MFS family permease